MKDQLDEALSSTEFDILEIPDVLGGLRSPKVRGYILAALTDLEKAELEVGVSFVHWDWVSENVHRGEGESESYCFF